MLTSLASMLPFVQQHAACDIFVPVLLHALLTSSHLDLTFPTFKEQCERRNKLDASMEALSTKSCCVSRAKVNVCVIKHARISVTTHEDPFSLLQQCKFVCFPYFHNPIFKARLSPCSHRQ